MKGDVKVELYTMRLDNGTMGIIKADDNDLAEEKAERRAKMYNCELVSIELSSEDEINWVKSMGGMCLRFNIW